MTLYSLLEGMLIAFPLYVSTGGRMASLLWCTVVCAVQFAGSLTAWGLLAVCLLPGSFGTVGKHRS